ncbi:Protein ZINC INDUCED FACILITATOR-LIKE 1 [Bulinus truncatus]|nr:Protein ZINC INDUCED FACILITATOR-LIKE 1 [Bulinus truncatus]
MIVFRLTDVWTTIMMYTVFSFTTIAVEDIFPVFASTTHEYGGLGFSTDEIGLAIGAMVLPLLVLQIKLYPFLVSKMGIRKVFLFSAMVSLVTCQALPTVRLLHNRPVWLWVCLIGMQIPFKIATNCCFAGTSLLINNAVTQDLAGQANGLAMMTTAMGRTLAPVLAGSLFSWSVTYGPEIGPPFDSSFAFFTIVSRGTGDAISSLLALALSDNLYGKYFQNSEYDIETLVQSENPGENGVPVSEQQDD